MNLRRVGLTSLLGIALAGCAHSPIRISSGEAREAKEIDFSDPNWRNPTDKYGNPAPEKDSKDLLNSLYYQHSKDMDKWDTLSEYHRKKGEYGKALEYANKMVSAYPMHSLGYHTRSWVYDDMKEYEKALADINMAKKYDTSKNRDSYNSEKASLESKIRSMNKN